MICEGKGLALFSELTSKGVVVDLSSVFKFYCLHAHRSVFLCTVSIYLS